MQGRSDIRLGTCALVFGPTAPAKSELRCHDTCGPPTSRAPARMLEAIIVTALVWAIESASYYCFVLAPRPRV